MREIDLRLLEDLMMHRSLNPHLEVPARTRILQAIALLLVLAAWGVVLAHSLSHGATVVAHAPRQAEATQPASDLARTPGMP
jgi:hypothetical protein